MRHAGGRPKRGRHRPVRGSRHPKAKLDEEQVKEILRRYKAKEKRSVLAKEFKVSWALIDGICRRGLNWKHLSGSPSESDKQIICQPEPGAAE